VAYLKERTGIASERGERVSTAVPGTSSARHDELVDVALSCPDSQRMKRVDEFHVIFYTLFDAIVGLALVAMGRDPSPVTSDFYFLTTDFDDSFPL
jgi:hypothetical protein